MNDQWITKEEAGARLGTPSRPLSGRRVLELAKTGRLQAELMRDDNTGHMQARIHAGSVERFIFERDNGPMSPQTNGHTAEPPEIMPIPATLARRLLKALTGKPAGSEELAAPPAHLWLTLSEAVAYSGLPTTIVQSLIGKGELKAMFIGKGKRGGPWRIRKADLEQFAG